MAKIIIDIPSILIDDAKNNKNYISDNKLEIVWKALEDGVVLPNNVTNGDIVKTIFPKVDKYKNTLLEDNRINILFDDSWWNAPYKTQTDK